jgi:hypothetical protein
MPVLPRWRHEIGELVKKLKRRELDYAMGPRPGTVLQKSEHESPVHYDKTARQAIFLREHPIVDVSTRQLPRIERVLLRRSCERPPAASGSVADASGRWRSSAIDREAFAAA